MAKVKDYNELFYDFRKLCEENNVCNAFNCITLEELEKLNYLLDRLILFHENTDLEELEDYECGDKVIELAELADMLFTRDIKCS